MPVNEADDVLHRIRIKLHKSNLPQAEGACYPRTDSEAELSIEDVSASAVNRGGVTCSSSDFSRHAHEFFDELAYLLCDGFAVNTGYFSIYPVVKKLFKNEHEAYDSKNHLVSFRFRIRPPLRRLAKHIGIEVEGPLYASGRIERFTDESGAAGKTLTPGSFFSLAGFKIKVTGDTPDCGVWFVSKADPSLRYKAGRKLFVNTSRKVAGIAPALPAGEYGVEVVTKYTVGGIDLKEPKTIKSGFTLVCG
ncbi:MAG: DUF4469 domain-containing protein [Treponema sp.]|nr:DUF4469 domain-containing protein [Treponema sp.]